MTPPVRLIHGASGNAATWRPVLPHWSALQPETIDLAGRGRADGGPLPSTAALASHLVAALPSTPTVLVGHSLGGAVALQVALDHAHTVSALVLVSSSARLRVSPVILQAVAEATPEHPFRLDLAFGPGTPRDVVETYARNAHSTPPSTSVADWTACNTFDVRERLAEVRCPVLVIHGSNDMLTPPKHQAWLAEALPSAERVELAGFGHMLPWEAPAEVASAVVDWVERLELD